MDDGKQEPEHAWATDEVGAYQRAERYVNGLIFGPPSPPPGTPPEEIRARAVARLARLRAFLAFLGNPQRAYRTIHITGTSGKGSTTTFVASILTAAGYRVGAHVSPYLQVATEKLQIAGRLWADNAVTAIRVNGVDQGVSTGDPAYATPTNFTLASGWIAGSNTIEVDVADYGVVAGLMLQWTSVTW